MQIWVSEGVGSERDGRPDDGAGLIARSGHSRAAPAQRFRQDQVGQGLDQTQKNVETGGCYWSSEEPKVVKCDFATSRNNVEEKGDARAFLEHFVVLWSAGHRVY